MSQPGSDLSRNLRNRHIQLIAIGGTIGVGLFLGSARAIHNAGPGLLLAYALGGVAIFLDRKSTRLNSSHLVISYAVFCLKKKNPARLCRFARCPRRPRRV